MPSGAAVTGVAHDAKLADTLAPGETVAVLRQAVASVVLFKIGTA